MPTTNTLARRKIARKTRSVRAQHVSEMLLEITYELHAHRVIARPTTNSSHATSSSR